jgi:hypothetical protein
MVIETHKSKPYPYFFFYFIAIISYMCYFENIIMSQIPLAYNADAARAS